MQSDGVGDQAEGDTGTPMANDDSADVGEK
jgi:hypothetical protein